ncbi:uncharacterized protein EV422DRAFT_546091 [Fimicolochytrium jonesii]|uniref:uncharacterized protein n=1 Tax=Fimicolochytrium jonesii TaxID=1396493 RepID=UPI0022FECB63|nr:uncharacterized protein EV422DRAFT_546091 [Fimicolochytrium jonesii]KAI8816278.1 hypothetical protein EV422DRAFT_546091 [Fimicolochytrium jonesii]
MASKGPLSPSTLTSLAERFSRETQHLVTLYQAAKGAKPASDEKITDTDFLAVGSQWDLIQGVASSLQDALHESRSSAADSKSDPTVAIPQQVAKVDSVIRKVIKATPSDRSKTIESSEYDFMKEVLALLSTTKTVVRSETAAALSRHGSDQQLARTGGLSKSTATMNASASDLADAQRAASAEDVASNPGSKTGSVTSLHRLSAFGGSAANVGAPPPPPLATKPQRSSRGEVTRKSAGDLSAIREIPPKNDRGNTSTSQSSEKMEETASVPSRLEDSKSQELQKGVEKPISSLEAVPKVHQERPRPQEQPSASGKPSSGDDRLAALKAKKKANRQSLMHTPSVQNTAKFFEHKIVEVSESANALKKRPETERVATPTTRPAAEHVLQPKISKIVSELGTQLPSPGASSAGKGRSTPEDASRRNIPAPRGVVDLRPTNKVSQARTQFQKGNDDIASKRTDSSRSGADNLKTAQTPPEGTSNAQTKFTSTSNVAQHEAPREKETQAAHASAYSPSADTPRTAVDPEARSPESKSHDKANVGSAAEDLLSKIKESFRTGYQDAVQQGIQEPVTVMRVATENRPSGITDGRDQGESFQKDTSLFIKTHQQSQSFEEKTAVEQTRSPLSPLAPKHVEPVEAQEEQQNEAIPQIKQRSQRQSKVVDEPPIATDVAESESALPKSKRQSALARQSLAPSISEQAPAVQDASYARSQRQSAAIDETFSVGGVSDADLSKHKRLSRLEEKPAASVVSRSASGDMHSQSTRSQSQSRIAEGPLVFTDNTVSDALRPISGNEIASTERFILPITEDETDDTKAYLTESSDELGRIAGISEECLRGDADQAQGKDDSGASVMASRRASNVPPRSRPVSIVIPQEIQKQHENWQKRFSAAIDEDDNDDEDIKSEFDLGQYGSPYSQLHPDEGAAVAAYDSPFEATIPTDDEPHGNEPDALKQTGSESDDASYSQAFNASRNLEEDDRFGAQSGPSQVSQSLKMMPPNQRKRFTAESTESDGSPTTSALNNLISAYGDDSRWSQDSSKPVPRLSEASHSYSPSHGTVLEGQEGAEEFGSQRFSRLGTPAPRQHMAVVQPSESASDTGRISIALNDTDEGRASNASKTNKKTGMTKGNSFVASTATLGDAEEELESSESAGPKKGILEAISGALGFSSSAASPEHHDGKEIAEQDITSPTGILSSSANSSRAASQGDLKHHKAPQTTESPNIEEPLPEIEPREEVEQAAGAGNSHVTKQHGGQATTDSPRALASVSETSQAITRSTEIPKPSLKITLHPLSSSSYPFTLDLSKGSYRLGRGVPREGFKAFSSQVVSRNHCDFIARDGRIFVQDCGSNSGTFVNGVRLSSVSQKSEEKEVYEGDIVQLGKDYEGSASATIAESRRRAVKLRVHIGSPDLSASTEFPSHSRQESQAAQHERNESTATAFNEKGDQGPSQVERINTGQKPSDRSSAAISVPPALNIQVRPPSIKVNTNLEKAQGPQTSADPSPRTAYVRDETTDGSGPAFLAPGNTAAPPVPALPAALQQATKPRSANDVGDLGGDWTSKDNLNTQITSHTTSLTGQEEHPAEGRDTASTELLSPSQVFFESVRESTTKLAPLPALPRSRYSLVVTGTKDKPRKIQVLKADGTDAVNVGIKLWEAKRVIMIQDRRISYVAQNPGFEIFPDPKHTSSSPDTPTPYIVTTATGASLGRLIRLSNMKVYVESAPLLPSLQSFYKLGQAPNATSLPSLNDQPGAPGSAVDTTSSYPGPTFTLAGDLKENKFIMVMRRPNSREQKVVGEASGRQTQRRNMLENRFVTLVEIEDGRYGQLLMAALVFVVLTTGTSAGAGA